MTLRRGLLLAAALSAATAGAAGEEGWSTRWDGVLYGYSEGYARQGGSVLNPGNRIARIPRRQDTAEGRFNFKLESEGLRLSARPVLGLRQSEGDDAGPSHQAYLSQWQAQLRLGEHWRLAGGRDLLTWGPAQFRSPANPFYFDNGRSNPLRELSGMDSAGLSWTPDRQNALYVAHLFGAGHAAPDPDPWHDAWLTRFEHRGEAWAGGLAVARPAGRGAFLGAHGQVTASDALLAYGEIGSATRSRALLSPADPAQPFALREESPRRSNALVGAQYTFDNGQSASGEYLYHGHGFTAREARAYFARAADPATPQAAALALGYAPPLLGRRYLHLVWQNSTWDEDGYWRLMFSRNLDDGSSELAGYAEAPLSGRVTAFALGTLAAGGARTEFSSLLARSLTIGVKVALP